MSLSRRGFVASSVLGGALALKDVKPTFAAAPPPKTSVTRAVRRKVGNVEVTALLDGFFQLDTQLFIGLQEEEATQLAKSAYLPAGPRHSPVSAYLVKSADRLVLIDAGTAGGMGPNLGHVQEALGAVGVTPAQINTVLLTHMHADHINGLLRSDGEASFPNAELVVSSKEFAFWHDDGNMARAPAEAKNTFIGARRASAAYSKRTRFIEGDTEVSEAIRSVALPGHTPGHTGFAISSEGEQLLIWGDIVHMAAYQFSNPDVSVIFDVDPHMAAETRKRLLDQAAKDRMMVAGMHMPFPGFGYVERAGTSFRFVAAEWSYRD